MTAALSYRSRALMALALALPIPLLAALGLSLPLPATVERLAAKLVPFADQATFEPRNGSIVAAPRERPAAISAPSSKPGLTPRFPRVAKTHHGSLAPAAHAPHSTSRGGGAQTSTTAVQPSTPSPTVTSSQPSPGGTETQPDPGSTQPGPTPTPTTPAPTSVVDTVTTTANNTVSTVANTVTTVVGGLPHP